MAERKSNKYVSEILFDLTEQKEGFDPRLIGYQKKHIWATCRFCGEPSRLLGANYKKAGSACHKECRIQEQKMPGSSPFSDPAIKAKAEANRTKNITLEEINRRISIGRKDAQSRLEKTCLEKYGVRNPFQSEEIKAKIKQTLIEKYGVETAAQITDRREKSRNTCLERYGADNPCQNIDVQQKISSSWRQRVRENKELYPIVTLLRSDEFWAEISAGETLSDICKDCDVPYQSVASILSRDEFKERFRSAYSYPRSQKQNSIVKLIQDLGLSCKSNTREIISPLELDIYIPEKNLAIEFNGSAWHSELMLTQKEARRKHANKTMLCETKGITLFHIFERTWDLRQSQVTNLLKSKLGVNETVFARNCRVNNDHCPQFLNDNHIQSPTSATLKYFNLVYNGNIVGSMTAARHHRAHLDDTIVLSRLCFVDGLTVVGGSSKLFAQFIKWAKISGYKRIISWSDNIYTSGGIYNQLGFQLENSLEPDYFYWDMPHNTYLSKQSQSKKKAKCPIHLTEREWAKERGLYRVWDCGKKRWEFIL